MRLHIIGLPSSGKTSLGMGLSSFLKVPYHDLDAVAFVDERWTLRPAPERDAMLTRIIKEPKFASEGGFLGWTEPLLVAADHVVWLDPPSGPGVAARSPTLAAALEASFGASVSGTHVSASIRGRASRVRS